MQFLKQKLFTAKSIVFFFVLQLLIFSPLMVNAKYVQTCSIKYKRNYDWSDYYKVEVTFMTGSELNKALSTYDYETYDVYGIVFWDDDKVTVIKISSYTGCGSEATQRCISSSYSNYEGEDEKGRMWEICTGKYCN